MSVQTFATDLGELIRTYLLTFDPAAPTEIQYINLVVNGANLGLTYTEQGGKPPTLIVSMTQLERVSDLPPITDPMVSTQDTDPRRGFFGGQK